MPALERSNPVPLYYQLKEVLRQQITSGQFAPNTTIPSEPELVASYQVSRATVRQALTELVNEGLLYRMHGKGTFVREPRLEQRVNELSSLTNEVVRRGKRPGGVLLLSELARGSAMVRTQLNLAEDEQVIRLERLRTADSQPIAYEVDYLPYPRSSTLYQRVREVAQGSLYQLLASEGFQPAVVEQSIAAGHAQAREADLLRVPLGEAVVRVRSTTFAPVGISIAYSETIFPLDRFDLRYTLRVSRS
jgi:DNA-binding GntR family transcriptional regulator